MRMSAWSSDVGSSVLSTRLAPAYAAAQSRFDWIGTTLALILAFAGGAFAYVRVRPDFRARTRVERIVMIALLAASLIAILTTVGIVASPLFESVRFFRLVPITDFLFVTHWKIGRASCKVRVCQYVYLPGVDVS